jgi:hypothetical protein
MKLFFAGAMHVGHPRLPEQIPRDTLKTPLLHMFYFERLKSASQTVCRLRRTKKGNSIATLVSPFVIIIIIVISPLQSTSGHRPLQLLAISFDIRPLASKVQIVQSAYFAYLL